jgi:hypothetical protein
MELKNLYDTKILDLQAGMAYNILLDNLFLLEF